MKIIQSLIGVLLINVFLAGCSAGNRLGNRLEGQWQISRYATSDLRNQGAGNQGVEMTNIGIIDFNDDQTGTRDVTYQMFQNTFMVNKNFRWSNTPDYVTFRDEASDSAKSWIVIENRKAYQQWKSTNGASGVQVLELRKPGRKGLFGGSAK